MVTSDFRPLVEIRPFCACVIHPAIIIRTVRSLWTWLRGRYHVPQNVHVCLVSKTTLSLIDGDGGIRGIRMPPTASHMITDEFRENM